MNKYFSWLEDSTIKALINYLTYSKHEFKFVGGCVRNSLLALPITDYDIASNLPPLVNIEYLEKQNVIVKNLGIQYGSILAIINQTAFEITSLRKDTQTFGRHAIVEFTNDFAEDASRRDFTINALYLCPKTAQITDYFKGQEDLNLGIIKFIGNPSTRIQEDYLRILRLFRFHTYYGKVALEAEVLQIVSYYAKNLSSLSAARISSEFYKIIAVKNPINTFNTLLQYNILNSIINLSATNIANFNNFINLEKRFNFNNILYRIAFVLVDTTGLEQIMIKKSHRKTVENIILLTLFIKKNKVIDWNEIAYLLANYSLHDVCGALINVASNFKLQHIYINILEKILAKANYSLPINGHDILNLVKEKQNIKLVLQKLTIMFWLYPIKQKAEYLQYAKEIITTFNY